MSGAQTSGMNPPENENVNDGNAVGTAGQTDPDITKLRLELAKLAAENENLKLKNEVAKAEMAAAEAKAQAARLAIEAAAAAPAPVVSQTAPTQNSNSNRVTLKLDPPQITAGEDMEVQTDMFQLFASQHLADPSQRKNIFWHFQKAIDSIKGAAAWLNEWQQQGNPIDENIDVGKLLSDFLTRFDTKVRTRTEEALENLLNRKVTMDASKGVTEYIARFREIVRRSKFADEKATVLLFRGGLIPELRTACRVDSTGAEFLTLDALAAYAIGEEKKLKERGQGQSRAALHYAASAKQSRFPRHSHQGQQKRPNENWASVATGNKKPRAGPQQAAPANPNGASTSGRAHGRAPPSLKREELLRAAKERPDEPSSTPDPRTAGRFLTNAEKAAWMDAGRCFKCGQTGHRLADCPTR